MDPLARLVSHEQTEKDVTSNEHMSFDDIDATHVSRSMPKCELAGSYMVARSKETRQLAPAAQVVLVPLGGATRGAERQSLRARRG